MKRILPFALILLAWPCWASSGSGPHWSDVLWSRDGNIVTAKLDGSGFEVLLDEAARLDSPRVSPDGKQLAYRSSPSTDHSKFQICVWNDDGTRCADTPYYTYVYTWDPGSRYIYYSKNEGNGQIWRIDFSALHPTAQLFYDPPVYRSFGIAFNHDGTKLFMIHDPHNWTYNNFIEVYDIPSGLVHTIYPSDGLRDFRIAYSPVRDELIWLKGTRGGCCVDPLEIWRMDPDGSAAVNLTSTPSLDEGYPRFSPDGESIYYELGSILYRMSRAGSSVTPLFDMGQRADYDIAIPRSDNMPPIADAGDDQLLEVDGTCLALATLDGSGSFDPDGDPLTFEWQIDPFGTFEGVSPSVELPPGDFTAILTVSDGLASDSDEVLIGVRDTTPPSASPVAVPDTLWPPNHKMVTVVVDPRSSDNCSRQNVACRITSVTSSDAHPTTEPDWVITGPLTVELRAERDGQDAARIYTISLECTDASGNTAASTVEVTVPHDQGH